MSKVPSSAPTGIQLDYTPVQEIEKIRETVVQSFRAGKTRNVEWRKNQLKQLAYMIQDNEKEWEEALKHDLNRHAFEAHMGDLNLVKNEAIEMVNNLDRWTRPEKVNGGLAYIAANPSIVKTPKGTVLIIGPFNYPINLTLVPMLGAIAAGNSVVIKPSEQTPACSSLMTRLIPEYLDGNSFRVVNGSKDQMVKLLELQWDHIFFTGSTVVGRIVAQSAAKHLTPVTLELGGKSPCVVLRDCNLRVAARRILWGKEGNAGQVCIAPDYILCPAELQDRLLEEVKVALKEFYPNGQRGSADYCKMVSESSFNRIKSLVEKTGGEVAIGGGFDDSTLQFESTFVKGVGPRDPLMESEIFGPLMPMIDCESKEEAVDLINDRPIPLALYVFTNDKSSADFILENTRSGTFVQNDTVVQFAVPNLPFGGAGEAGYGSYHGKRTFDVFTHERAYLSMPNWIEPLLNARYPPFSMGKLRQLQRLSGGGKLPFDRPGRPGSKLGYIGRMLTSSKVWALLTFLAILKVLNRRQQ